ncbi:MAG: hypothetical protein Kow0079_12620 [Vicingaceae bacterium]
MKNRIIILSLLSLIGITSFAQQVEYAVVTSVESIIPMGLGRSRIIHNKDKLDVDMFTTERVSGKDSEQGKIKRKDVKVNNLEETKLLNFYSGVGINFQNIASNDAMIAAKLNAMAEEGWVLFTVVSGVESDAGKDDGQGIFITRYIFQRIKQ